MELGCHDNSIFKAAYNESAMQCRLLKIIDYLDVGGAFGMEGGRLEGCEARPRISSKEFLMPREEAA